WTGQMYRDSGAVHHVDVVRGNVVFRVFLLASTLQVDLAFWPSAEFGAVGPSFRLLFGTAEARPPWPPPAVGELVGLGWLHALHARSSIERGQWWQAEYMVSGVRDQVLALACLRHGLPAAYARGADRLPPDAVAGLDAGLVRALDPAELRRAFRAACAALGAESARGADRLPPGAVAGLDAGLVRALDPAELRRAFRAVCAALVAEIGRGGGELSAGLAGVVASLAESPAG